MRRAFPLVALLLAAGLSGCIEEEEKESVKEGGTLRFAPPVYLPPPAPATFSRPSSDKKQEDKPPADPTKTPTSISVSNPEPAPELAPVKVEAPVTLQLIFERYGKACYGMDPRFLKAVAQAESGLNPKNRTGKHIGLFQIYDEICRQHLDFYKAYLDCSNLEDPEVNTAVAAARFDAHLKRIFEVCKGADAEEAAALAYVGHNNGPGVLRFILGQARAKGWCKLGKQEEGVRAFYRSPRIGNDQGWYEIPKKGEKPKACHNQAEIKGQWSYHCITEAYGARKWKYGLSNVVLPLRQAGVEKLYSEPDPSKCPALQVPPRRLMVRSGS